MAAPVELPGTLKSVRPLKHCDKHGGMADQEGGIQIGSKWYCAACWRQRQAKNQRK